MTKTYSHEQTERQVPLNQISKVRRELMARRYNCLSSGQFGLPSYTDVEAWSKNHVLVYLVFDRKTGGWDLLAPLDNNNSVDDTWIGLELHERRVNGR